MCTVLLASWSLHLGGGIGVNVAEIVALELSVMLHDVVPEQPPPDHPANVEPGVGVAVSATLVPSA
jgi:hypothetical protein